MEEKEEKGFVVKDRRKFSLDDAERETETEQVQEQTNAEQEQTQPDPAEASREDQEKGGVPLPEVTLATFIFSLSSSALVHLGEIPDPETNNVQVICLWRNKSLIPWACCRKRPKATLILTRIIF